MLGVAGPNRPAHGITTKPTPSPSGVASAAEAGALQELLEELGLPDTNGHARLREWANVAWSVAPVAVTDMSGVVVPVHKPCALPGVESAVTAPWVEAVFRHGLQSSNRLSAAAINCMGGEIPDFVNHARFTGESAAVRQQRFYDVCTLADLNELHASREEEAIRSLLTAKSAAQRASLFDTWIEWCLGVLRLPFRWEWVLGDRMSTQQRLEGESLLIKYSSYLSVRYSSFGALRSALDAVKFVHTDYLSASPNAWDSFSRLDRHLHMIEKLMMRAEPCRRQRDVLSPTPSLVRLAEFWSLKARAAAERQSPCAAILAMMHKVVEAACFTSGLRVQSVCPGDEWSTSGDRKKFWSLYSLVQLEALVEWDGLSTQARQFHGQEDHLVVEHRTVTTPVEEYILLTPPKQKVIYMSKKSNEISRRRWPYELRDTQLNLPSACCELFTHLDSWAPGWRRVSHLIPAVFDPNLVVVDDLLSAIHDGGAMPDIQPLSPDKVYRELKSAVLSALPAHMHDLRIGDHVYRKSCHVAWGELTVPAGSSRRHLTARERDQCLGRSTEWSSAFGSGRDYDEATVELVRVASENAERVEFTTIAAVDGRGTDHSTYSAVPSSVVNATRESSSRKRRWDVVADAIDEYADDTLRLDA